MLISRLGSLAAASLTLALAGCGSTASTKGDDGGDASPALNIVASTDVYGDIVKQVVGTHARVTSIISNPDADPHSYEANTQNQLSLSKADLVIQNGGGYDDFVSRMVKSSKSKALLLDVVTISGKNAPADGELNEHVWYDFPTMVKLVDRLVPALSERDSADASSFRSNAERFKKALTRLESREASIKRAHAGESVAITEPVPLYMLQACGLVNKAPEGFSEAIEEGTDVPPVVLKQTLDLFTGRKVSLLAYNQQTAGPETEKVLKAAQVNNIAVVPVRETLPKGDHYLNWMGKNLSAIDAALT